MTLSPKRSASGKSILRVRLARSLAQVESTPSTAWILCPWLARFPHPNGVWFSVLAAHDINEQLMNELPRLKQKPSNVYAGIFAVDVLRSQSQLIRCLKNAGIGGVINFPSASFFDGEAGAQLNDLSLGIDREIAFLKSCAAEGLRIAGLANSVETARALLNIGVNFIVAHGGPPTRDDADPSESAARSMIPLAKHGKNPIPVIQISTLMKTNRRRTRRS